MISVALFSILTGLGNSIVFNIDKIIINQILGLSQTGVYTIAFFFGTLVIIPSRALLRISGTLIADAFKRKDLKYIADIYHRSCLNQFIIGAFIFGGIWINIDNILEVLGPDYEEGKWVIIIIGLAYLFDMLTGANSLVIAFSPFYKVALIFILILIVLVVGTMYLLVPEFGVVGGAVAIGISIIANNIMRYTFLKIKYGMQPFNAKFLFVLFIFAGGIGLSYFLPKLNLIVDILIRSTIFAIIFISGIYVTKASEDFNLLVKKLKENYLF
jgi:O-antigen/teichoic acid export membrane protein